MGREGREAERTSASQSKDLVVEVIQQTHALDGGVIHAGRLPHCEDLLTQTVLDIVTESEIMDGPGDGV